MPPKFIYFDLGNVLLNFDHHLACKQMSDISGVPADLIYAKVFEGGLKWQYEAGQLTRAKYYELMCAATGMSGSTAAEVDALDLAGSSIFRVNATMLPVVVQLESAGYRMGILSNVCESHWNYVCQDRFGIIPSAFEVHALSFRIGAIKPEQRVFDEAAKMAGVEPGDIFYMDDMPANVAAAIEAGYDAVQYTTTPALVAELHKRGVRMNY